jgi:hypothetical protein
MIILDALFHIAIIASGSIASLFLIYVAYTVLNHFGLCYNFAVIFLVLGMGAGLLWLRTRQPKRK